MVEIRITEKSVHQDGTEGLELTGPDGLLAAVGKNVVLSALESEVTQRLGYGTGGRAAARAGPK